MTKGHLKNIKQKLRYVAYRIKHLRVDRRISKYLGENHIKKPTLMSGYRKSGNTWVRLVLFNYFNIKNHDAKKALSISELNSIENNKLERRKVELREGFPNFWWTHFAYTRVFDKFQPIIYLYRNPLDTLISEYYFHKNREVPFKRYPGHIRKKLYDIDYFVLYKLEKWIWHYKITAHHADIILCYKELKKTPYSHFERVLRLMGEKVDREILEKSIDWSSFDKMKRLLDKKKDHDGMSRGFTGKFTRSGKVGQYYKVLKTGTIEYVKRRLDEEGINIEI
jgi:hypothetical protein